MKKSFLIGIAAAAMLASCSNDETVEMAQSKAISFSDAFVNKGTRSIDDPSFTKSTLGSFAVYGYSNDDKIFSGDVVSSNDGGATWIYSPYKYWFEDHVYTFGAIAPAPKNNAAVTVSDVSKSNDKVTMTVNFTNMDGTTDLLYAAPNQVTADAKFITDPRPVAMTFNHQLSKVKFSFANAVGESYKIKVKNVRIEDARGIGILTIGTENNAWSDQDNANVLINFGNVVSDDAQNTEAEFITNGSEYETYYEKLLIPTPSTFVYTVKFIVDLYQGEETDAIGSYNHTVQIKGVEFKLGYCYDFKAELTADNIGGEDHPEGLKPIEFTVTTVNGWTEDENDQTLTIPEQNQGN